MTRSLNLKRNKREKKKIVESGHGTQTKVERIYECAFQWKQRGRETQGSISEREEEKKEL